MRRRGRTHRSVAHIENALLTVREHSSKQGILPVCAYVIESACCQFSFSVSICLGPLPRYHRISLFIRQVTLETGEEGWGSERGGRNEKATYLFS
jgi:hypothetical protein